MKLQIFDRTPHCFNYKMAILVVGIALFGVVMVYSASSFTAQNAYGNEFYFASKQLIGVGLGIGAMLLFYFINYHNLAKLWILAVVVGLALLVIVFIPNVGIESYGAKRWIGFGAFSFQASEVAKFCFIIFTATYMTKFATKMTTFWGIIPILLLGGTMCLLILLEPNMSITICLGVLMLIMILVGGARLKHLSLMALPMCAVLPALIIMEPYRLQRLMAFINPWASPQGEGFQLIQSLFALGSGGWFGVGLFNSRQKFAFLPFSESDFIFSIIGEELGFVGCLVTLFAFGTLIFMGYKIAIHSSDKFGCYLAVGITSIFAVQVVLNIAVVTGTIPPTGLPLPLVSAGSTSIVMFMAGMGILLNIYRNNAQFANQYNPKTPNFLRKDKVYN